MEGWMEEWTDRPYFIGPLRLRPGNYLCNSVYENSWNMTTHTQDTLTHFKPMLYDTLTHFKPMLYFNIYEN